MTQWALALMALLGGCSTQDSPPAVSVVEGEAPRAEAKLEATTPTQTRPHAQSPTPAAPTRPPETIATKPGEVIVASNAQGIFGRVHVGVGNFRPLDAAKGVYSAMLWIGVEGDPSQKQTVTAKEGDHYQAGGMRIEVKQITASAVVLRVTPKKR